MIARLLQFVLFVLVFRFVWRLVVAALGAGRDFRSYSGEGVIPSEPMRQGEMVRDPVCGVYVLRQRAIEEERGGKVMHFCSEQCRAAFGPSEARVS